MDIHVSKHAIKRYRERLFDYSSSDAIIESQLIEIACRGKQDDARPATLGNCYEVAYKGVSIVLVIDDRNNATILTCLGNANYRKWIKQKEPLFIKGRMLYPEQVG